jgi:hypothetical protein
LRDGRLLSLNVFAVDIGCERLVSVGAAFARDKFISQSLLEGAAFRVVFKDETELEVFTVRLFSNDVNPAGRPQYSLPGRF